jgi:hypothetical protein
MLNAFYCRRNRRAENQYTAEPIYHCRKTGSVNEPGQIMLYLRLEETTIHLSSVPYAQSAYVLIWHEGSFLLMSSPSTNDQCLSCTGKTLGASLTIQHIVSQEALLGAETKNPMLNTSLLTSEHTEIGFSSLSLCINISIV